MTLASGDRKRKRRQLLMAPLAPNHKNDPFAGADNDDNDDDNAGDNNRQRHNEVLTTTSDNHHHQASTKPRRHSKQSNSNNNYFANNFHHYCNPFAKNRQTGSGQDGEQEGQFKWKSFVISSAQQQQQQAVGAIKMTDSNSAAHNKARRKSELSSFLTILFGALVVLLLVSATCRSQSNAGDLSSTMTRARTAPVQPPVVMISDNSMISNVTTSTTTSSLNTEDDESSDDDADDLDNSGESAITPSSSSAAQPSKLRNLIVDSANSGADLLIGRLRAPSEAEPVAGEEPPEAEVGPEVGERTPVAASTARPARNLLQTKLVSSDGVRAFGPDDLENKLAMEIYAKWKATGDDIIELFSRKMLPVIMEHAYDVDAGTVAGILQVFNGIRALKPWALKLLDAWAKLSPGVLIGTQSDFGDFDECLSVRVDDPSGFAAANPDFPNELDPQTGLKSTTLVGRYCLADVEFPKPARHVPLAALQSSSSSSSADDSVNASQSARQYSGQHQNNEQLFKNYSPIELRRPLLNFNETTAFKDTIFVETGNFFHMLYVDPLRVGICLTNKIDPDSFAKVFNKLLEEFAITINFQGRCVTKYDKPQWTIFQQYSAYCLIVACSLVLLSTSLDLIQLKLNKLPWPVSCEAARIRLARVALHYRPLYTSFSLIRNTKRLFKPQGSSCSSTANRKQYNLNLANGTTSALTQNGNQFLQNKCNNTPSISTSTTGSIPDSSVESSPSIERRSSTYSDRSTQELIHNSSESSAPALLLNQHNTKLLHQHNQNNEQINLLALHGIRVITMTWMIVNHTYMFGGFFVLWAHRRLIDIAEWPKSLSFQMVLNGWLTVETYFFLSALIIVLNVMPLMRRSKFNYPTYVLHRLLRLLPAYIGLVCLNFLWPLISSGPVWLVKGKSFVQTPCENYLWTNFLFINNWIWPEKQCMVHTWFLSADFQLYILAPMIVYLLYRRPALGHTLNLLIAILASILSGFVIYANKLLPTTLINKLEFDAIKQQLSYSYFATYQHVGPYCLGILTGYLLHKRPHVNLPKHLTWMLWILLPPLSFTTLLLTYLWNGAYDDPAMINPSPLVSAFYVAIHRTIWTALVAWLVFACATGRAKLLSQMLSHSLFIPISRLSYSIYLVHLPVIMFRALNLRTTVEWTDQNILWEACGNFVASIFMGYFLYVAFESPIINLENYISGRDRPTAAAVGTNKMSFDSTASNGIENQTSGYLDGDSASAGETNSSHGTESSATPEQERKSSSSSASTASSSTEESIKKLPLMSGTSQRKSLQPKQTSVARIFGGQMNLSNDDSAHQYPTLNSSQRQKDSQNIDRNGEESIETRESMRSRAAMTESIRKHDRLRMAQASSRLSVSNNEGDLYNITGEYRHYAPGGYAQWRMFNQGGPSTGAPSGRPQQYATLARTTRITPQDRIQSLGHQYRPSMSSSRQMHQQGYPISSHNYPPMVDPAHLNSDEGHTTNSSARMQNYAGHQLQHQLRRVPFNMQQLAHESGELEQQEVRDQQHEAMMARRRQARYNTMTGTDARDLRSYYTTNPMAGDDGVDLDSSRWAYRDWAQLRAELEAGSNGLPAQQQLQKSQPQGDGSSASSWIHHGAMIPRIDSSTLRRQARRQQVDTTASSSIIEETVDHGEEGDEETSVL